MMDIYNNLLNILSFVTGLVYLLLFKSILDNFSCKKFNDPIIYIVIFLTSIFIFIFKFESSIIFILICVSFYKINYKQNILKCFFIGLIYWFCIYMPLEYISLDLVFNINYNDSIQDFSRGCVIVEIESMIIQNIFMLVIFQICTQRNIFKTFKNTYKKINYMLICIPIFMNILMMIVVFRIIAVDKALSKFYILILIIMPILILISKIYIFYMMKKNIYSYKLDYENKIIKDNVLKESGYYLETSKEKDKVKSLYHDMKNHMICVRHLCKDKDINKALEYIDSMENNITNYSQLNQKFYTKNMILDSILRVKESICIEKDIDFLVDMDFSKNNFMDMVDVCTIFSNVIDNAIEACDKINEPNISKKITLKSKYIDGLCIILIENTKINEIKKRKKIFLTSKKNSNMHGIGLHNVKRTIEKYFGEVIFKDSKNMFTVKIMIPYKSSINS
jgi:DNA-dependent RNA polymerase auxiliary subunit epsilon